MTENPKMNVLWKTKKKKQSSLGAEVSLLLRSGHTAAIPHACHRIWRPNAGSASASTAPPATLTAEPSAFRWTVGTVHSQAVNKISTQYHWTRLFSFLSQYKPHEANDALIAGVPVIFKKSVWKKLWLLTMTKCKNDSPLQRIQLRHKLFWGFSCSFFKILFGHTRSWLWHSGSLVAACTPLAAAGGV